MKRKQLKYIKVIEKDFKKAIKKWHKTWTDCECDNCLADFLKDYFQNRPKTSS